MSRLFPNINDTKHPSMVFVDGENFAIRYQSLLGAVAPLSRINHEKDTFVWANGLNSACLDAGVRRKHYYTSVQGDDTKINATADRLKDLGIEAPRVFKRTKNRGSKRVDISLSTEMLMHAARRNYQTAVLIAGDEDYIPLVEAVQAEGCRVLLWFVSDGLSPALRRAVDHYTCLDQFLLDPNLTGTWR